MSTNNQEKMSTNRNNDDDSQILSKIGENLYLKPEKADVYFIFESTSERIPAHKIILSSGSDVFEAMFYGSLKEAGDIKIIDASAEAFKEFLRFFYFNKVELSIEYVSEAMYLGKKYDVVDCLRLCENLLTTKVSTENVVSALGLSLMYDQMQLQELCESKIRSNTKEILQSPSFLECDRRVLNHILNMDRLTCLETELFEASMSWTRSASKREELTRDIVQTHMGDSFYVIRFGSMSLAEFAKLLAPYGDLLSVAEYKEILQMISQLETQTTMFKRGYRTPVWDENNVIKCNRLDSIYCGWYDIQSEEVSMFSTNTMLVLGQFVCVKLHDENEAPANMTGVQATISSSNKIQMQFSFDYVCEFSGVTVKLPKPVVIQPSITYEIRLKFPSAIKSDKYLRSIVILKQGVFVEFCNDRKHDGRIIGVIEGLGFNMRK